MMSCIFINRYCPRNCKPCAIKRSFDYDHRNKLQGEWSTVAHILKQMGCEFVLILGNEPWMQPSHVLSIAKIIPTASYTSVTPNRLHDIAPFMFKHDYFQNFSFGCDFPKYHESDDKKSNDAWNNVRWVRKHYPDVQCSATITVSRENWCYVTTMIRAFAKLGVHVWLNHIHANVDGSFDFCTGYKEISDAGYLFESDYTCRLVSLDQQLRLLPDSVKAWCNNLKEYLDVPLERGITGNTNEGLWHCKGDPTGMPTVDSDGSLRCCGYRKGRHVSTMSIFDLMDTKNVEKWKVLLKQDTDECKGCVWSCPITHAVIKNRPPEYQKAVHTTFQPPVLS